MAVKHRLIAGCINQYPADAGWKNHHLDKSGRPLWDLKHDRMGSPPEYVMDLADLKDKRGLRGMFHEVRCWQVLEHLTPTRAPLALEGFFTVLKPGGVLDIEVPNVEIIIEGWKKGDLELWEMLRNLYGSETPGMQDDHFNAHRWGWVDSSLRAVLEEAGFENVKNIDPEHYQLRMTASKP